MRRLRVLWMLMCISGISIIFATLGSHHHLATMGQTGSVETIATPYFLENYFTDAQDIPVQKMVHIEAGAHPDDALKETLWLQAMADATRFPQAIVAHATLNNTNVEAVLEAHSQHKNLRGIRHIINWHSNPNLTYTQKIY